MISIVGAGSGAADLITVRGARLLGQADVIVYAGSLVNPQLLSYAKEGCEIHNSAKMTLEEVVDVMAKAHFLGKNVVRLHTGDPSIYGAIREQMDALRQKNIPFEVVPGVSSFCGAAAALQAEYTLPGVSQTVIITRAAGRTPVPEKENIRSLAAHRATMAIFLSAGLLPQLTEDLVEGGYPPETPAAIVYKATWPDEKVCICQVSTLADSNMTAPCSITPISPPVSGKAKNSERGHHRLHPAGNGHRGAFEEGTGGKGHLLYSLPGWEGKPSAPMDRGAFCRLRPAGLCGGGGHRCAGGGALCAGQDPGPGGALLR